MKKWMQCKAWMAAALAVCLLISCCVSAAAEEDQAKKNPVLQVIENLKTVDWHELPGELKERIDEIDWQALQKKLEEFDWLGALESIKSFFTEKETPELRRLFPTCEKISIDYAVMEKSPRIYVIAEDLAWSDLGSWGSIKTHLEPDQDGNCVVGGDVRLFGCQDCFVHTADQKRVVVEGLEGYIVAESKDRLLICRLSQEQHIKEFSA